MEWERVTEQSFSFGGSWWHKKLILLPAVHSKIAIVTKFIAHLNGTKEKEIFFITLGYKKK